MGEDTLNLLREWIGRWGTDSTRAEPAIISTTYSTTRRQAIGTNMANLIIGLGYLGEAVLACPPPSAPLAWFATTRRTQRAEEIHSRWQVHPIVCDVLRPETLKLPAVETVLYCVGFDRQAGAGMHAVYVDGLRNVLDHLPPPRRFLYVSSTSVYGQQDGSWVDESSATEPVEESGKVVLEAEILLRSRLPDAVLLRFAGIYGPGRLLRQQAIQSGQPLTGDPQKWLNLIHVADGARAVLAAAQKAQPGQVYNVADGCPATRQLFYAKLAKLLQAPEPRFCAAGTGAERFANDPANRRVGNGRMRKELKVDPRYGSFEEGLPASLEKTR
jgi:nucleoside-diphosphate-sugar epimerase